MAFFGNTVKNTVGTVQGLLQAPKKIGGALNQFATGVSNVLNPINPNSPPGQLLAFGTRNVNKPTPGVIPTANAQSALSPKAEQGFQMNDAIAAKLPPAPTGNITPQAPTPPVISPVPQPYSGQGLSPEQQAAAKTPEEIAKAQGGTYNPPNIPPSYNTNPYNSQPPSFAGITGALANTAAQPTDQYTKAQETYGEAAKKIAELETEKARNPLLGTGTDMRRYLGVQGLLANQIAQQEQAQTGILQAAGTQMGAATAQQQAQQAGLGAAAGLAYPIPGQALGFYSPTTGEFTPYGGGQGGGLGAAGQVIGTLGIAQNLPSWDLAYNQAASVKDAFVPWLENNKSVLPTDANLVNELKQWAQGAQFSDPRYPELNQFLNEYLNTITPLIGASGNVTNFKQGIVQQMINPTSSADSIIQQINNLHSIAKGKLDAAHQQVANPNSYSQGTPSASLGNVQFYQDSDGTWKYK